MSDRKSRHRRKKMNGKSFVILPIIFLLGTYLVMYFALAPALGPVISASSLLFSDEKKDYSTEFDNIFVPVDEENNTVPTVTRDTDEKEKKEYIDKSAVEYPHYSDLFGQLIIENCGIDAPLFFGDGDVALQNGVGIYNGSFIPGYGGTILVAGHNNTYFNGLKYAEKGQEVLIRTSYGNYRYRITDMGVKKYNDSSAYDLSADHENLIMYTCYPFDMLGLTEQRYFVYAEYVSGTQIDKTIEEAE